MGGRANPERQRAYRAERMAREGDVVRAIKRANHNLRRFDLTVGQFETLWRLADGRCYLCRRELRLRRGGYAIDHDTKGVRGLLCVPCNTALGSLGDDDGGLMRAHNYVKHPPADQISEIALARLRR